MKILSILALAVPLFAANSVVLKDTSSSTASRPFSIHRVFAKGEIANYAQPSVSGTPLSTWQCDVENRWGDGSLRSAMISFNQSVSSNSTVTVSFVNNASSSSGGSGLDKTGMLAFNSSNWDAEISIAASGGTTRVADARTMMSDSALTLGNFNTSLIRTTLSGPVVTQMIVEDRSSSRSYDFGWTCVTNCTDPYTSATYADDTTHKSIHPYFVLTAYAGWAGMKVEYIVELPWNNQLQDLRYTATFLSGVGLGTTKFGPTALTNYARVRWHETFWDGTTPATSMIDWNFSYLISTKSVPNYDLTRPTSNSQFSSDETAFAASDKCAPGNSTFGLWQPYIPSSGPRDDIALINGWAVRELFAMSGSHASTYWTVFMGQSECAANNNGFIREGNSSLFYDAPTNAVNAFGRSISVNAEPTFQSGPIGSTFQYSPLSTLACDQGIYTFCHWQWDTSHIPNFCYLPWLLTGEYYWLECLQIQAADEIGTGNPNSLNYGRHGASGYITWDRAWRSLAWGYRDTGLAAYASRDSSPEQAYFQAKLTSMAGWLEGFWGLLTSDGAIYYNNTDWNVGKVSFPADVAGGSSGTSNGDIHGNNPLRLMSGSSGLTCVGPTGDVLNCVTAPYIDDDDERGFMWSYGNNVFAFLKNLGTENIGADFSGITTNVKAFYDKIIVTDATCNPFHLAEYSMPVYRQSTKLPYDTCTAWNGGWNTPNPLSWPLSSDGTDDIGSLQGGYMWILGAALSFYYNTNDRAYQWWYTNIQATGPSYYAAQGDEPIWMLVPALASSTPAFTFSGSLVGAGGMTR